MTTPQDVLACPMEDNDANAATVKEYLIALLSAVWSEQEGFSGKRPFGNSGWAWDLYEALATAGMIEATWDTSEDGEDRWLDHCDTEAAHRLIREAIGAL